MSRTLLLTAAIVSAARERRPVRETRLAALESTVQEQTRLLQLQSARIADLERVVPKDFEVIHYNVLADQCGTNMQPWFCYGAQITAEEREELHRRFYRAGDANKRLRDKGWPSWAEGVLSAERIRAVEAYDAEVFAWQNRRERLWRAVASHRVGCRERTPDVITLAECDHFGDFWKQRLESAGYSAMWRKRPRATSADGCAIAWRTSTFSLCPSRRLEQVQCLPQPLLVSLLRVRYMACARQTSDVRVALFFCSVASGGFDFGNQLEAVSDRTCAFALLRWRRDPSVRLLVATTHLARDPESEDLQWARGFQYGALFRELLAFAGAHDAEDVPVILTGDLNAKDCDELAGIARALVRLLKSPTHPLLWSVMDAPTSATTVTEERHLRIDYILYQSSSISLTGVGHIPQLEIGSPIPDLTHPSDHLPVSARFILKSHWDQVEENARQWLACVSGTTAVRPLSGAALRSAFAYFDKDGTGVITPIQLQAGMEILGFPGLSSTAVRAALRRSGCDATGAADRSGREEWSIRVDQFVQVYTDSLTRSSSAMAAQQLQMAFAAFDPTGSGVLTQNELREALRRMASAPLDEEELRLVLRQLSGDDEEGFTRGPITIASFSNWMMSTYTRFLKDPSLVYDSMSKWPDAVYNQ